MANYKATESEIFAGINGDYKLIRFERGGKFRRSSDGSWHHDGAIVKIELYRIRENEPEAFVGYVPRISWGRRGTCGADRKS